MQDLLADCKNVPRFFPQDNIQGMIYRIVFRSTDGFTVKEYEYERLRVF